MVRALRAALACALITLAITGTARAAGGNYAFDGGTPDQRAQVRAALEASAFPWGVVPRQIVIHIAPGLPTQATPGEVWLDSNLVESGEFAWALIQHEYAHQVDFLLLGDASREALTGVLGARTWCWGDGPELQHAQYGCERFASTLVWAFWPSESNALKPKSATDEAAALPPAQFKALLGALLKAQTADDQLVTIRQFVGRVPAVNPPAAPAAAPGPATVATAKPVAAKPVAAKPASRVLTAAAESPRRVAARATKAFMPAAARTA